MATKNMASPRAFIGLQVNQSGRGRCGSRGGAWPQPSVAMATPFSSIPFFFLLSFFLSFFQNGTRSMAFLLFIYDQTVSAATGAPPPAPLPLINPLHFFFLKYNFLALFLIFLSGKWTGLKVIVSFIELNLFEIIFSFLLLFWSNSGRWLLLIYSWRVMNIY